MPVAAMLTQVITTFLLAWVVGVTAARVTLKIMILITVTIVILTITGSFSPKKGRALLQQRLGL